MKISVAICTWNRAALLERTLESATALQDPGCPWELVLVDNGSTDRTPEVLGNFADRLPLRVIHEPTLGHSNARNAALDAIEGEYVIWTDDDVLLPPDWLVEYRAGFERHPEAWFFGGPIDPWMEAAPPEWFDILVHEQGAGFVFALLDLSDDEIRLERNRLPYGANMAFKTEAFNDMRFDPRLGLKGDGTTRGEETHVLHELMRRGADGWWLPKTRVLHWVPKERMTLEFLHNWWLGAGAVYAIRHPPGERARTIGGVPLGLLRTRWWSEILFRLASLRGDWAGILHHLRRRARAQGAIAELRGRTNEARPGEIE